MASRKRKTTDESYNNIRDDFELDYSIEKKRFTLPVTHEEFYDFSNIGMVNGRKRKFELTDGTIKHKNGFKDYSQDLPIQVRTPSPLELPNELKLNEICSGVDVPNNAYLPLVPFIREDNQNDDDQSSYDSSLVPYQKADDQGNGVLCLPYSHALQQDQQNSSNYPLYLQLNYNYLNAQRILDSSFIRSQCGNCTSLVPYVPPTDNEKYPQTDKSMNYYPMKAL